MPDDREKNAAADSAAVSPAVFAPGRHRSGGDTLCYAGVGKARVDPVFVPEVAGADGRFALPIRDGKWEESFPAGRESRAPDIFAERPGVLPGGIAGSVPSLRLFAPRGGERGLWDGIARFREQMLAAVGDYPLGRHISCPQRGSACKRLHLFLRWMVRREGGIDLGLWERVRPSDLSMPLDVHVGRVSRSLGLLTRRQNDRGAVEELDGALRRYDPSDPVKYDLALFSLGESGVL